MQYAMFAGLLVGLFVTNALIGYFLRDMSLLSSLGFGALAALIAAILYAVYYCFTNL